MYALKYVNMNVLHNACIKNAAFAQRSKEKALRWTAERPGMDFPQCA